MATKQLEDPPKRFRHEAQTARQPFGRKPGPKKSVNLSVDAQVLKIAKEMSINLSMALEDALRRLTEEERARRFYDENKALIDRHNALAERFGTLTEELYGPDAFDDPAL